MKTEPKRAPVPERLPSAPPRSPLRDWRSWTISLVVLGLAAVIVLAVFLSIYPRRGFEAPIGWDMSEYLWRTTLAQKVGLAALSHPLPSVPVPKSGRPAFPVIAGTLSSVLGVTPFRLAFVLPSVMAAALGLAAGAFVGAVLRRPLGEVVAVALAIGLSSFVVRLMAPEAYMDTLFAAAVFLVALTAVILALERPAALVPAVLLLGAGAVIHWSFFAFFAATLVLAGAALLPESVRRWRAGDVGVLDTPTARLGEALLGGAALGGAAIFALLGNAVPRPRVDPSEFAKKLRRDLPKYHLPFTLPAATLGGVGLALGVRGQEAHRTRTRHVLAVLLAWCAVVAGGYVAMTVFDVSVPAHRFFSFGLAIPVLGILGVLWVGRRVARAARPLGVLLVAGALAGAGYVSYGQWVATKPWTDSTKLLDAERAESYLEAARIPVDRPVVFIVGSGDWNGAGLMGHIIRAALPAERIQHVRVFVGSPEDYLLHRPTDSAVSRGYFKRVRDVYRSDPVAVMPASFNLSYWDLWLVDHPDRVAGDRVAVVQGPTLPPAAGPLSPVGPPVGPVSGARLGLLGVAVLVVLFLIGLGWSVALLGRWLRPGELVAAAPGVGVAVLVVAGLIVDRLGVRVVGLAGGLTPIGVAVAGWVVFLVLRRARPGHAGAPTSG